MGKINWGKVIVGGVVAGIVLNVVDFVMFGVVLQNDYNAAMQALGKPPMAMTAGMLTWFIVMDLLFGIWLVWLYAAMRPRFGAGPKTAINAGLAMWLLWSLLHALSEAPMGLFPTKLYVIGVVVALIQYPLAAAAGAKFYTEA